MSDRRFVEVEDCLICDGSGWRLRGFQAWSFADTMVDPEPTSCEDCRGTGVVPKPGAEPFILEDGGSGVYEEHSDPEYLGRRFQIWFEHPDGVGDTDE